MIIRNLEIDFPENLIPENVDELIDRLDSIDNREVGRRARKEEDRGEFSYGLIKAVKEAIQLRNRLDGEVSSYKEARENQILQIRFSDGSKKARKKNERK